MRGSRLFDSLVDHFFNLFSDTKSILGHSISVDAQNFVAFLFLKRIAFPVAEPSFFLEVIFSVDLSVNRNGEFLASCWLNSMMQGSTKFFKQRM